MSFSLLLNFLLTAQKKNEAYQLHIRKAVSAIKIDGVMDEEAWARADIATDFFMVLPMDTSHSKVQTQVRMAYDNQNIYLLATCYHSPGASYRVESLRRDFVFGKNDNFLLFIDPFEDQTNGFTFGVNAAGAQWDGMLYEGGKADLSWDNKWNSAVKDYSDRWILEAAIPFKSIRYKKGISNWGINFSRLDITVAEKSSWAPVPRQFPTASLAYTGTLIWDQPPPETGANISLIPSVFGSISRDIENTKQAVYQKEIALDAKIAITSAINLDLAVNPDFSQVEVDRQVTNLDRYELFFPEKRQFFLENADLFANFGYATLRPFFSRRIGLGVPIQFGARFSGKLDKNWRMGFMDMQTQKVNGTGLPGQNFAILALQRKVFSRSNIGIILINKQSIDYLPGKDTTKPVYSQYNRNIGLEYNLASANNIWTGKMMLLKSFSAGKNLHDLVFAGHLQYSGRKWNLFTQYEYAGKNYNAEVGYVPRKGYVKINPTIGYTFLRKSGKILSHGPKLSSAFFFNEAFHQTDNETFFAYSVAFRNQSTFLAWVAHDYVKLLQGFDPTNTNKDTLARGTEHRWNAWGTEFVSKPQGLFTYGFSTRYGGYYINGSRLNLNLDLGYRFQPYVNIALSTSYNNIQLPMPWGRTNFWLVGPRIDVTFSNKLFFTTFFQYNEQQNNMNLNTRFQWRYKPASDLFIVYTDNYYPVPFSVRNRAVVLKFTYWWNM